MTMTMTEAANRLNVLAEAYHRGGVQVASDGDADPGFVVSALELEAVTTAAAILGLFVEALEDTTT